LILIQYKASFREIQGVHKNHIRSNRSLRSHISLNAERQKRDSLPISLTISHLVLLSPHSTTFFLPKVPHYDSASAGMGYLEEVDEVEARHALLLHL
jgi:hypothetical protein